MTSISLERDLDSAPAQLGLGRLWAGGLLGAALCTWTLYDALPGLNWALCTAYATGGIALAARRGRGWVPADIAAALGLAMVLATSLVVTADPAFHAIGALAILGILSVVTVGLEKGSVARVPSVGLLLAPAWGALLIGFEYVRRLGDTLRFMRGGRALPALRGLLIAAPVVAVFAVMLASADPTLASWERELEALIDSLSFVPRLIFFAVTLTFALGALGLAAREPTITALSPRNPIPRFISLGDTERLIIFGAVGGLFALFFGLQLSYLFGNAPAIVGTGVTFAEYARRGFGELTVVTTLCTLLIIAVDRVAVRGDRERKIRLLQLLVIGELQALLQSAFHRVLLYESAYGFTTARLYAQAYMIVVTLALVMLAWEVWRGLDVRRLATRVAATGVAMLALLAIWNHEAWIVGRNVDRWERTGRIDAAYLGRLSLNAVPAALRAMPRLPAVEATTLRDALVTTHRRALVRPDRSGPQPVIHPVEATAWYEFNVRRERGLEALRASGFVELAGQSFEREWSAKRD